MLDVQPYTKDISCINDGSTGRERGEVDGRAVALGGAVRSVGDEHDGVDGQAGLLGASYVFNDDVGGAVHTDQQGNLRALADVVEQTGADERVTGTTDADGDGSLSVAHVAVVGFAERQRQVESLTGGEDIVEYVVAVTAVAEAPVEVGGTHVLVVAVVVIRVIDVGFQVDGVTGAEVDIVVTVVELGIEVGSRNAVGEVDLGVEPLAGLLAGDGELESGACFGVGGGDEVECQCAGGVLDGGGHLLVSDLDDVALVHPRNGQGADHQRYGVIVRVRTVVNVEGVGGGHVEVGETEGDGTAAADGMNGEPVVLTGAVVAISATAGNDGGVAGGDVGIDGTDAVGTQLVGCLTEGGGAEQNQT